MTDKQALKQYVRGQDPDAFGRLVARYQHMVYATARRSLGNHADAEDATQETFLRLARSAGTVRGGLGSWLHRCATNVAIDRIRQDSARRRREGAAAATHSVETDARDQAAEELSRAVDRAIAGLGARDRSALVDYYMQGQTQAEMSRAAGISQAGISRRLDRALARVRQSLRGEGIAVASGALVAVMESSSASAGVAVTPAFTQQLVQIGVSEAAAGSVLKGGFLMATIMSNGKAAAVAAIAVVILGGSITAAVMADRREPSTPSVSTAGGLPLTPPPAALQSGPLELAGLQVEIETVAPQTLLYSEHPFTPIEAMRIGLEWFPALFREIEEGGYDVEGSPVLIFFENPQDADDLTLQVAMPVSPDDLDPPPAEGFLGRRTDPFTCASAEFTGSPFEVGAKAQELERALTDAGYTLGYEFRTVISQIRQVEGQFTNDMTIQFQIVEHSH